MHLRTHLRTQHEHVECLETSKFITPWLKILALKGAWKKF